MVTKDQVRELLERIGRALSAGDVKQAAACWTLPGLFLSDEGATLLTDSGQLEQMFAQATQAYHAQGLVSTRADLKNVENLSETIASIDVRWPAFDASGAEKQSERSYYLVQSEAGHGPRIRVALTITA